MKKLDTIKDSKAVRQLVALKHRRHLQILPCIQALYYKVAYKLQSLPTSKFY